MKIRGVLAGLGVMILAGCSSTTATVSTGTAPETFDFKGTMVLILAKDRAAVEAAGFKSGDGCKGDGGYADLKAGAAVTIYDDAGKVIGSGGLDQGEIAGKTCSFDFIVPDVPTGGGFYQYEVTHRGKLTATEAEARAGVIATLDNS